MRDGIMKKGLIYSNDKQQNVCNDVMQRQKSKQILIAKIVNIIRC